ncbi:MAG: Hpt domain-containing protein [Abyssibacter sp.]|jgi:HPt (histidine-containing phosphotransfer) domain-containing protein|uniref:Hpt domain-containing protein n=1 Tax=Abyssibacter sp. TaxID=2320200 RepID=UPI00321A5768
MNTAPPCDLKSLQDLLGDIRIVHEICRLFLSSSIEARAAMERQARLGDGHAFAREAHKLKGICGNVQAIRLRGICEELELSSESLPARWARLQAPLDEELDRVQECLTAALID